VLEARGHRAAAISFGSVLATRLGLERAAIGLARGGRMRVVALSHSASFDPRAGWIAALESAMDEAADQDATIEHPARPGAPPRIARAHERLARLHDAGATCTTPLASGGRVVGALTLEAPPGEAISAEAVRFAEDAASLLGPAMALQRACDAGPLERARERLRRHWSRIRGPGHPRAKAAFALVGLALPLVALAPATYRVRADATLEGRVQRAIVAGVDGFVGEARVRAGDVVKHGELLGRLDERDLVLERRRWAARRDQLRKEYREALASHERSEASIRRARLAEADAQLALLDEGLARTRLEAPFDGVVVEGDLSQALGSPVEKGQVLFQVASLDGYRIVLEVDERDIADVAPGQRGELALAALPGSPLPVQVEAVTPVSRAEGGRNTFRVEARLEGPDRALRPGMEGVAKVVVGRRRLLWTWTHGLADWLRLALWSWWP
jgi:RND family efflux transporter MFP subunit